MLCICDRRSNVINIFYATLSERKIKEREKTSREAHVGAGVGELPGQAQVRSKEQDWGEGAT